MNKKSKKKTTTLDPFYYDEDFYIYGPKGEPPEFYDHDWFFENGREYVDILFDVNEVLMQIYHVACFVSFFINFIHLFILTRKELRTNIVFIVMIAVCICDIFHSFGKILQLMMTWNMFYTIETCDNAFKYSHQMVDIVSRTIQIMNRQCSGFLVFFVAAFRAFSVMYPMHSLTHSLMKPKSGVIVVLFTVVVSGVWSCVYFFQARVSLRRILYCVDSTKVPSYIPWEYKKNQKWENIYMSYDGIMSIVISILYFVVTIVLMVALFMNRKRRKNLNKGDKSANTSLMIVCMAMTVLISESTYGLLYFINLYVLQDYEEQKFFEELSSGVLTLLIFKSIFHVIICFFMSSQYRDTVKGLICGKKEEKTMVAILENTIVSVKDTSRTSNSSKKTF